MCWFRRFLLSAMSLVLLVLGQNIGQAQVTHFYEGNLFNVFGQPTSLTPYGWVTVTLTFASEIPEGTLSVSDITAGQITTTFGPALLTSVVVTPISSAFNAAFSMEARSDPPVLNPDLTGSVSVFMGRNAYGRIAITDWDVVLTDGSTAGVSTSSTPGLYFDSAAVPGEAPAGYALNDSAAGAWDVPEPTSFAIWSVLAATGAAVSWRRRRRQNKLGKGDQSLATAIS